jgi:hypothetical protein
MANTWLMYMKDYYSSEKKRDPTKCRKSLTIDLLSESYKCRKNLANKTKRNNSVFKDYINSIQKKNLENKTKRNNSTFKEVNPMNKKNLENKTKRNNSTFKEVNPMKKKK